MLAQLEVFLNCAVPYLYNACNEEDFIFTSLEKLAQITDREEGQPSFDNIMRRSFYISKGTWEKYNEAYTSWMCRNVKSALKSISAYFLHIHGIQRIRFEITKKKK